MASNYLNNVKINDLEKKDYEKVNTSEDCLEDGEDPVPRSAKRGWSRFSITTEPIFLVVLFTISFTSGPTIDLLQDNVCQQRFNLTWEECNDVNLSSTIKSEIEAMTADVNMVNNVIQGAFPVILSLLIGPWSDTNGRKPFMIWAMRGYTSYYFLWGILSLIPSIPVMCFVLPALPLSLSGGWVACLVCTWSYTADVYDEKDRPLRLSLLMCSGFTGSILGNALAAQVFYASGRYGYQVIFFTSSILTVMALLYVTYILKETVTRKVKKTNFFNFENFKSIFVTLLIKPRHKAIISILIMAILTSEITANSGDVSMIYLVGKSEFSWTLGDYNLFSAVITVLSATSPVIGVWIFQKKLGWHNYTVLAVFSGIMFTTNILKAASVNETMFWASALALKLSAILGPCMDTEISKLVYERDLGKAYAFSSLIDALCPVIAIPIFTELYKYLLPDRTLYVFFSKAALSFVTCCSSTTLLILFTYYRSKFWNSDSVCEEQKPSIDVHQKEPCTTSGLKKKN